MLRTFPLCDEWLASLSLDDDIVARIFALPDMNNACTCATEHLLHVVLMVQTKLASFRRRAATPSHLSLLAELLKPRIDDAHMISLVKTTCKLLKIMQRHNSPEAFDQAGIYVACVESLGQLYRQLALYNSSQCEDVFQLAAAFLCAAYKSQPVRLRILHLLLSCPGALTGVVFGVIDARYDQEAPLMIELLDTLRRDLRFPESFLLDTHYAGCALVFENPGDYAEYAALVQRFVAEWRKPASLRALAQPLHHQRLAAAVALACLCGSGVEFERILAAGDCLNLLVAGVVDLALERFEETSSSNSRNSQLYGVIGAVKRLAIKVIAAPRSATAEEPPSKRQRITGGGAMLGASDVNVKRRDSTVLLIAGRPFYVIGALLETKSKVLADALSSVETLDPVVIALPNEVPEEQQHALFHAAVEHAYTGTVASDVTDESLLPLWCLGDHLQMEDLCTWCVERLAPALRKDTSLLERTWSAALSRPSDALCDACAAAWLVMVFDKSWDFVFDWLELFKRVHDGCAEKELPAAQLVRVLRKGLLEYIAAKDAAAATPAADEQG